MTVGFEDVGSVNGATDARTAEELLINRLGIARAQATLRGDARSSVDATPMVLDAMLAAVK